MYATESDCVLRLPARLRPAPAGDVEGLSLLGLVVRCKYFGTSDLTKVSLRLGMHAWEPTRSSPRLIPRGIGELL
eukprot:CAMPEP_0175952652 /NCGR_PEP_ID=MMETSP0108-20121206/30883_1 /TAXON_ID=195067 ORGANISM="Goniomonas pacifica, Strain CCMP1869" /NCGR_SAMPLE_ID=MMETSP0108 /ASSEMBLY_ACC=CAM_ASM_000204 /LENGTH=74 /DNA_ID=CAMNT_0017279063 /DNA_START=567 /DNA_END=791 /DNA_ORIENTATION=-